jgi:hypothetical protein
MQSSSTTKEFQIYVKNSIIQKLGAETVLRLQQYSSNSEVVQVAAIVVVESGTLCSRNLSLTLR